MASSTDVKQQQESQLKKSSSVPVVVLRVSIHCEGCKRKVKKLLQSLPGVDDIQIQRFQQRVVVTGDVSPQTLLTKLVKSGKNAELWPQKPPDIIQESSVSGKEIKKMEIPSPDPSKVNTTNLPSGGGKGSSDKVDEAEKLQVEVKAEDKKPETGNMASPTTVVEKKEQQNENNGAAASVDGEGKKKKKKKKAQSSNKSGNTGSSGPPQDDIGSCPMPTSTHSNQTVPCHQGPPPAPVYTMSYHTAHPPVNSYTTSYYAPSPPPHSASEMTPPPYGPQPTQSYGYDMGPPTSVPSGYESYGHPSSEDSFEMFSDENPNGCSVM